MVLISTPPSIQNKRGCRTEDLLISSGAYLQQRCVKCCKVMNICASCYRGQHYCGQSCREKSQASLSRLRNRRYQLSLKGRLSNRLRQARFRARQGRLSSNRMQVSKPKEIVTDATSKNFMSPIAEKKKQSDGVRCFFCGVKVYLHMQDSLKPATDYRRTIKFKRRRSFDQQRIGGRDQVTLL